jgi:putative membrane protein
MTAVTIIASSICGAFLATLAACIPGLHIYNIMGILALVAYHGITAGHTIPVEISIPFALSLVTAYSIISNIPSILLAAPDESSLFTVLPGQKYFFRGKGLDAILLTGAGSAIGLLLVVLLLPPVSITILPIVHKIIQPHTHWIIWCIITFMLMSEWPRTAPSGQAGWIRFLCAWQSLAAGIIIFLLAGILGFIIFFSPTANIKASFINLMPAFIGIFTIPWLILNLISKSTPPPQNTAPSVHISHNTLLHGCFAGLIGGGFAAFFPIVTGGVGGFLAGHASAMRNDKSFLISQGTSKVLYYVGGLLLFFVPQLGMKRGGAAWMMNGIIDYSDKYEFFMAITSIAISGIIALILIVPLTRLTLFSIRIAGFRTISLISLLGATAIVITLTGLAGLTTMVIAAGIGLLPSLFGTRRMNCLGIILLPMACNMSGIGYNIAHWMGLT